jgi:glycine betaine/proline transport system substrate-binding protein
MKTSVQRIALVCSIALLAAGIVFAEGQKESSGTKVQDQDMTVDFVEVQWSDIASTTATTRIVLEGMGYETTSKIVSVPIAFEALGSESADIFLGDWQPSMKSYTKDLIAEGSIIRVDDNLQGAKYTLAVPSYVAEGGVKSFGDIAKYPDELESKIYGIEPGNDGNLLIQEMIDKDAFGLGNFELIASSEAGMLAQVRASVKRDEWIVFLGWEPHPMNTVFDLTYLKGGDDYFGPNYGEATVYTLSRPGYVEENPNLGRFFQQLQFKLQMENEIMKDIADGMEAHDAAMKWLKANPGILDGWLEGVKTADGKPALPAVKAHLGL